MKAFGYIRVSGLGQGNGDGPIRQREAIAAYAAANDIEIVEWFEEIGISGKTEWEDRPVWSEMIGRLNGVRTIVLERLDRLARDLFVQEYILRDLKKRDVQLLTSASEETGEGDPTRVLFRQILGAIAQYDRTMIVRKLKTARDRIKRDTGRCEGRKPYGTFEGERDVLETMQGLRTSGATYDWIADYLNGCNIKPRSGNKWYGNTVNKILSRGVLASHARAREGKV